MVRITNVSASHNTFFVGDLSDCAMARVVIAIGKKRLETLTYESHEVRGAFVSDLLARRICAHCLKNGEIAQVKSREPLPFRLFIGNTNGTLKEITDRYQVFSLIGYQPKKAEKSKKISGNTVPNFGQRSSALV